MQKKYKHLFFDLDRTLWDFEKSAAETFEEIYQKYKLNKYGVKSVADFHAVYTLHNNALWEEYRHGRIEKKVLSRRRFFLTLKDFGINDENLGAELGKDYVAISPTKVNLFPNAVTVLDYLSRNYPLHIITNGFSEVQDTKLRVSGMGKFFQTVITSEEAGVKKPNPEIFNYALGKAGAEPGSSLMIGDDFEVDIVGAKNAGLDQVLFDPENINRKNGSTFVIRDLGELKGIL